MLFEILLGFVLLGACVVVHAGGMSLLLGRMARLVSSAEPTGLLLARVLVETAGCLLALHLFEIFLWAVCYRKLGCLPDLETAMYFSGVTYATIGYGDVVLTRSWWLLGPFQGLTGILLCGLSTGFFFVVLSRLFERVRRHSGFGRD